MCNNYCKLLIQFPLLVNLYIKSLNLKVKLKRKKQAGLDFSSSHVFLFFFTS